MSSLTLGSIRQALQDGIKRSRLTGKQRQRITDWLRQPLRKGLGAGEHVTAEDGTEVVLQELRPTRLLKGRVRAHPRTLKSGKIIQVREHTTKVQKKEKPVSSDSTSSDQRPTAAELYEKLGTRSPYFKAWFGDWEHDPENASKVVDPETGEPKETYGSGSKVTDTEGKPVAVHHGTAKGGYRSFRKDKIAKWNLFGAGFYFTEDRGVAEQYKNKDNDPSTTPLERNGAPFAPTPQDVDVAVRFMKDHDYSHSNWGDLAWAITHPQKSPDPSALSEKELERILAIQVHFYLNGSLEGQKAADLVELCGILGIDMPEPPEVKSVYLNIRNPFRIGELTQEDFDRLADAMEKVAPKWRETPVIELMDSSLHRVREKLYDIIEESEFANQPQRSIYVQSADELTSLTEEEAIARIRYLDTRGPLKGKLSDLYRIVGREPVLPEWGPSIEDGATTPAKWLRMYPEYLRESIRPFRDENWPEALLNAATGGKYSQNTNFGEFLQLAGYDGITHIGGDRMGGGHHHRVWIAFEPNQIKAVDNEGAFDINTDDIYKSISRFLKAVVQHKASTRKTEKGPVPVVSHPQRHPDAKPKAKKVRRAAKEEAAEIGKIVALPLSKVHPDPNQHRDDFPKGYIETLADSIKEAGQKQPISVRPEGDGTYRIIFGECRWRACRLLKHKTINAIIRENISDEDALAEQVIENLTRLDVHPTEEAKAYRQLADGEIQRIKRRKKFAGTDWSKPENRDKLEAMGRDYAAKKTGKRKDRVNTYITLNNLTPEVKDMLDRKSISIGHALALLRLIDPHEDHRVAEDKALMRERVLHMERMARHARANSNITAPILNGIVTEYIRSQQQTTMFDDVDRDERSVKRTEQKAAVRRVLDKVIDAINAAFSTNKQEFKVNFLSGGDLQVTVQQLDGAIKSLQEMRDVVAQEMMAREAQEATKRRVIRPAETSSSSEAPQRSSAPSLF